MSHYIRQIETALEAVHVHAPNSFSWFGKRMIRLPRAATRQWSEQTGRGFLRYALQAQLYRDFYCPGFATPTVREVQGAVGAQDSALFVAALQAANQGRGSQDTGWAVVEHAEQAFVVEKDRLRVRAGTDDLRWAGREEDGDSVSLWLPNALGSISPGFYMALGDTDFDGSEADLRLYWNLKPAGAAHLLRAATGRLNRARIPYRLKVLNDPARYTRCDAGVLYVRAEDYPRLALERIYREVRDHLKPMTPSFTKPLAPGLALAEDPGGGQSFGLQRCSLLADGVLLAYDTHKRSLAERLAVVLTRLAEQGVSAERPYLNRGSNDRYPFRAPAGRRKPAIPRPGVAVIPRPGVAASRTPLETADAIGRSIVRDAVLHGDICNWVGPVSLETDADSLGVAYQSLGPDLYGGVAGISLFLAELHAATGSDEYRDLALRATRCALQHADRVEPRFRLGLYLGWVGIAYSAAYVGLLLKERSLAESALRLVERLRKLSVEEHELDLLAGNAGAIAGLVTLYRLFPQGWLLDFAIELGDDLIEKAEYGPGAGCSWPSPANPRQPNLLGFSHGTAGIVYALRELFRATGLERFGATASRALRYEDGWFQRAEANWPDFRDLTRSDLRRGTALPLATLWCHGAPGIALARLRAAPASADESNLEYTRIALDTTRAAVESWLAQGTGSFCLCHGLAGNADILLHAARLSGPEPDRDLLAVVDRVARVGSELHSVGAAPWPCGTGAGETPALMLGLAGIGHFYLRRSSERIPSILILEPEAVGRRFDLEPPVAAPARMTGAQVRASAWAGLGDVYGA